MSCKPSVLEKHYGDYPYRPDVCGVIIPGARGRLLSVIHTAAGPGLHPVVLLPCDIGRVDQIAVEDPFAFETIKAVLADAAPWLRGVTEDSLLREARAGAEDFRLENLAGQLAKKPVFCISGDMDIYTPPRCNCLPLEQAVRKAGGIQFRRLSLHTDHCFSDYRLTVAQRISDYLTELVTGL